MRFSEVVGNDSLKHTLASMVESGRVPQALLLYENDGCGALALAVAFLQMLNCPSRSAEDSCGSCPVCGRVSKFIHPDIHFVFPTNTGSKSGSLASKDVVSDTYIKDFRELALANPYFLEAELNSAIGVQGKSTNISVTESSLIMQKLSLTSVEDGYKAVVMYLPEKLNVQAANKLLKIVEEPPLKTVFILITHDPQKVLQTIFSRCQSARVLPLSKQDWALVHSKADSEDQLLYAEIFDSLVGAIMSRDYLAALAAGDTLADLKDREKQKAFCLYASQALRSIFMIQQGMKDLADADGDDLLVRAAATLKKTWPRKSQAALDRASMLLERNVSQKILFCDLVNKLYSI